MSKILLERAEWQRINEVLDHYKGINYCEIDVESIGGIGKITKLIVPHSDNGITGEFTVTITDESDW